MKYNAKHKDTITGKGNNNMIWQNRQQARQTEQYAVNIHSMY